MDDDVLKKDLEKKEKDYEKYKKKIGNDEDEF